MSSNTKDLYAVHSIQTSNKDGERVDVNPGDTFTPASEEERASLLASGAASDTDPKLKKAAAKSSAEDLPTPPIGYAPGTARPNDVNFDPNDPANAVIGSIDASGQPVAVDGSGNPVVLTANGDVAVDSGDANSVVDSGTSSDSVTEKATTSKSKK